MDAPSWDEVLLCANDGFAPADRPEDVHFYLIYYGKTYKQRPRRVPAPGNEEEAQRQWDAGYGSAVEVARRKARKSAMRRPDPVEAVERRVEQRRANPEQEAVNLGALAQRHLPFCSHLGPSPRVRVRKAARRGSMPVPPGCSTRIPSSCRRCCIPALIAAHLQIQSGRTLCRPDPWARLRNQTHWTERTRDPALQQRDGVFARRLGWAGRYSSSTQVRDRMSCDTFRNVRDRMSCAHS